MASGVRKNQRKRRKKAQVKAGQTEVQNVNEVIGVQQKAEQCVFSEEQMLSEQVKGLRGLQQQTESQKTDYEQQALSDQQLRSILPLSSPLDDLLKSNAMLIGNVTQLMARVDVLEKDNKRLSEQFSSQTQINHRFVEEVTTLIDQKKGIVEEVSMLRERDAALTQEVEALKYGVSTHEVLQSILPSS